MPSDDQRRVQQAVRIHALTDPLGAMGFRQSRRRVVREGRARRLAAVGAIASFVASLVLIVRDAPPPAPAVANTGAIEQVSTTQRQTVNLGARPPGLVEPTQAPVRSHTRTRSSD